MPPWIEPVEDQQAKNETADVGLPRHRALSGAKRLRQQAEDNIDDQPQTAERQHPRIGEQRQHRRRRPAIIFIARRSEVETFPQRRARLKHKPAGSRHRPCHRSRGADDWRKISAIGNNMRQRAGNGSAAKQHEKARRSKAPRDGRAERQQPYAVDTTVGPVGVQPRVSQQGPHLQGAIAEQEVRGLDLPATGAGQRVERCSHHLWRKAVEKPSGYEGEMLQQGGVIVAIQPIFAPPLHARQDGEYRHDDARRVENFLAG